MEKNKLTNCKACGATVAKDAKICPACGAKIKKKHPIFIGIICFFALFIIVGSIGENKSPKKEENNTTSQTQTTSENTKEETSTFLVGETAELNDIYVTMLNVSESAGSTFNTPADGNVFVICEFEIENKSAKDIAISSMMSFEAYCDNYTCTYSLAALLEKENKNQLDGTVASGKKFNGIIGYEVPENWKELEIRFTPDFWSGKEIIFVSNK